MKSGKGWLVAVILVLVGVFGVEAATAQTDQTANAMTTVAATTAAVDSNSTGGGDDKTDTKAASKKDYYQDPDGLRVTLYPVLAYMPIFGANFRFPNIPTLPIFPGNSSTSSGSSLNGAAFFGFTIQKKRIYFDGDALYAGLSASGTVPTLNVPIKTNLDTVAGHGQLGYKFYKDFYLTGGFRLLRLKYGITVGTYPQFVREPTLWDPLLGMLWKRQLSKKWTAKIDFEGGGFGVGANSDISLQGQAEWQFAKHFGLVFGYGLQHLDISHTIANQEFDINQTLNGPIAGFGIYF